jgi:hypothetical protein
MKKKLFLLSVLILACLYVSSQRRKIISAPKQETDNPVLFDSIPTTKAKDFSKIISGAKVSNGLFNIYKTKTGSYYMEVPDSMLQRDMLMAARVINISDNSKISAGQMRNNPVLIYFSRRDKFLFINKPTRISYADPKDMISVSLDRNNVTPIVLSFDIVSRNDKNDASVIDITKFYSSEVELVWPSGISSGGHIDTKASQILDMKSFPQNVNIKSYYNYTGGKEPFCITINYSFVLLPKEPMKFRLSDDRIGYSSENKRKFVSEKPEINQKIIDRWRIEPRDEDVAKYKRGELVIPKKQLIYYVDTVMPEIWRKYVRQGIEDWNVAFKEIGFKNVIIAKDYPRDRDFDSEDIRNTCFRYITSTEANASGPQWIDPRSGEIIQADILWWHNVIDLLQTWKFVQTAAVDPDARKKVLDEKFMGETIRYAVAHETGHTLGLQHNMRGSYAYPTDSLRSPSFTKKYGTTASIMDYARNNYVAQPGDKEKGVRLSPPILGPYDYFAIKWGYTPIFNAKTPEDEKTTLNKWFVEKGNNPMFLYAPNIISQIAPDPSSQTDVLGNDMIKSSLYGISNLKIIVKNLLKWTLSEGDDFELLIKRFEGVNKLYDKLVMYPISYLGGVYTFQGTVGQYPAKFVPVEKTKQQETIHFVIDQITTCQWLDQPELNKYLGSQSENIAKLQSNVISSLLGNFVLSRFNTNETLTSSNAYSVEEYLKDIDSQIWTSTSNSTLTNSNKHIQLTYVDKLISMIRPLYNYSEKNENRSMNETLWASAATSQLISTRTHVNELLVAQPQNEGHYRLILNLIDKATK